VTRSPDSRAATFAAVLALFCGVWHIQLAVGAVMALTVLADVVGTGGWDTAFRVVQLLGCTAAATALCAGGVLLFHRNELSRRMIAIGCAVAVLLQWIDVARWNTSLSMVRAYRAVATMDASFSDLAAVMFGLGSAALAMVYSAVPVLTVVLTYRASTLRWIRSTAWTPARGCASA
jgi:hypothetical protein